MNAKFEVEKFDGTNNSVYGNALEKDKSENMMETK